MCFAFCFNHIHIAFFVCYTDLGVIEEEESILLVLGNKDSVKSAKSAKSSMDKKDKRKPKDKRSHSDLGKLKKQHAKDKDKRSHSDLGKLKKQAKEKDKRSNSDLGKLKASMSLNDNKSQSGKVKAVAKDINLTKLDEDGFVILEEEKESDIKKGGLKPKKTKKIRSMTEDAVTMRREKGLNSVQKDKEDLIEQRRLEQEREERRKEREEQRKEREALRLKLQKQKEEAKARRKQARKEQREHMGDYFVATCWRFVCYISIISVFWIYH